MRILGTVASSSREVPNAPTIGTATDVGTSRTYTPQNGGATVTFTAPTWTGGLPVLDYTATSSPGGFTATGAGSPLTVNGLAPSTLYSFTVKARNAVGLSAASAASNNITATTVPQAPTIGTATATGATTATVAFTANATGGKTITSYTATSSPGGITASGATSPITVTGLTSGTAYTFTVTASNANGTSGTSAASNSITPTVPNFINLTGAGLGSGSGVAGNNGVVNTSTGLVSTIGYLETGGTTNMAVMSYNTSGTIQWQRGIGATASEGKACGIDSAGNIYAVGSIQYSGYLNTVVVKYNSSGTILWQRTVDRVSSGITYWPATAEVGPDDGLVVSLNQGATTQACSLIKFDSSGNVVYSKDYTVGSASRSMKITGIDFDSSGNIIVASYGRPSSSSASQQSFVHKFDSTFTTEIWGTIIDYQTNIFDAAGGIYVDSSNNTYVVLDAAVTNNGNGFVKLDSSGNLAWQRIITSGYTAQDNFYSIAQDSSGFIYVLTGNANVSGASGKQQANIFKYNSSGTLQWQRSLTVSSGSLRVNSLRISGSNIYLSGYSYTSGLLINGFLTVTLPTDGSKTGSYSNSGLTFTYAASSFTDAAGSAFVGDLGNTKFPGSYSVTSTSTSYASNTLSYTSTTTSI